MSIIKRKLVGKATVQKNLLKVNVDSIDEHGIGVRFYEVTFRQSRSRKVNIFTEFVNGKPLMLNQDDINTIRKVYYVGEETLTEFLKPIHLDEESSEAICDYYKIDKEFKQMFTEIPEPFEFFQIVKSFKEMMLNPKQKNNLKKLIDNFDFKISDLYFKPYANFGATYSNEGDVKEFLSNDEHVNRLIDVLKEIIEDEGIDVSLKNIATCFGGYKFPSNDTDLKNMIKVSNYSGDHQYMDLRPFTYSYIYTLALLGHYKKVPSKHKDLTSVSLAKFVEFLGCFEEKYNLDPKKHIESILTAHYASHSSAFRKSTESLSDDFYIHKKITEEEYYEKRLIATKTLPFNEGLFITHLISNGLGRYQRSKD